MASPVTLPPLPPQRRRTPFGAIMLILLGVLFLLVNTGALHARQLFPIFATFTDHRVGTGEDVRLL